MSSARSAAREGTGRPPVTVVRRIRARRESDRAAVHGRRRSPPASAVISSSVAAALVRLVTHDVQPHRGVADVTAVVEIDTSRVDRVEVLRERLEVSHGTPTERVSKLMSSTFCSVRAMSDDVLGTDRRDREAAVAGDDARHAVERRRRERRVPEDLRVVVAVDVDEAGRDDLAAGIELAVAVQVRRRSRRSGRRATATSAGRPGDPVPSTSVPPRMTMSPSMRSPCVRPDATRTRNQWDDDGEGGGAGGSGCCWKNAQMAEDALI